MVEVLVSGSGCHRTVAMLRPTVTDAIRTALQV